MSDCHIRVTDDRRGIDVALPSDYIMSAVPAHAPEVSVEFTWRTTEAAAASRDHALALYLWLAEHELYDFLRVHHGSRRPFGFRRGRTLFSFLPTRVRLRPTATSTTRALPSAAKDPALSHGHLRTLCVSWLGYCFIVRTARDPRPWTEPDIALYVDHPQPETAS